MDLVSFLSRVTGKTFPGFYWCHVTHGYVDKACHVTPGGPWKGFSCNEDPLINLYGM